MKRFIQSTSLVMVVVLLIAIFLPNILLNSTVFAKSDVRGSTIGGVELTDVKDPAFESALQAAITEWQGTAINVSGGESAITIDSKNLTFDIATAFSQYEAMTSKPWYAVWEKSKVVHIQIPVTANEEATAQIKAVVTWKSEETLNNVLMQASYLRNHEVEAVVNEAVTQAQERIGFQIADIPADVLGIPDVIDSLNDTLFVPEQPVSLLTLLGENTGAMNQEGLDFLASMLYSTVLQTDYEILERHAQSDIPSYLQPGTEASINPELEKDLQFVNLSQHPSKLHMTIEGNSLKVEIFSQTKEKDIKVRVEKDRIVNPRIIYRYSDELAAGQEKTIQEGTKGLRVEVYRSIVENGVSSEVVVSRDYYAPVNRIVERSSRQLITNTGDSQTNTPSSNTNDPDLQLDLDGNGLPDTPSEPPTNSGDQQPSNDPEIVYGYYDKGGNFVQTSP